ncbi:hypothetical protein [Pseudogemmobacter sonorensis]|uniref:hypothetical protein n=1 Tax=Pseudogemmobacter sonorensis TaxID=2989681 RepID=UPI0036AD5013
MPQADLYFTTDNDFSRAETLAAIEDLVRAFDAGAGVCKGRAHPVAEFHHSHIFLRLSLLPKPHRDAEYAAELGRRLAALLRPRAAAEGAVAVNVSFDLLHYTAA